MDGFYRDLLDQLLIVCFDRVEAVDHVVDAVRAVRGGVAQRHERMELLQPFLGLLALDRLRLVDYQYRIGTGDDVDGATAAELVQLHVDAAGVRAFGVERLTVDDHAVDGAVLREVRDVGEFGGVVDEEPDRLAVLGLEVLLRDLERFIDALADGDAGDDDDELAPAVELVQLVNGLYVCIGLADAGLHLDGQVDAGTDKLLGGLDLLVALHFGDARKHDLRGERVDQRLVGEPLDIDQGSLTVGALAGIDDVGAAGQRLPGENVADRARRVFLKFLMLELEFHRLSPSELATGCKFVASSLQVLYRFPL